MKLLLAFANTLCLLVAVGAQGCEYLVGDAYGPAEYDQCQAQNDELIKQHEEQLSRQDICFVAKYYACLSIHCYPAHCYDSQMEAANRGDGIGCPKMNCTNFDPNYFGSSSGPPSGPPPLLQVPTTAAMNWSLQVLISHPKCLDLSALLDLLLHGGSTTYSLKALLTSIMASYSRRCLSTKRTYWRSFFILKKT